MGKVKSSNPVGRLMRGRRWSTASLAGVSFVGGLLEAGFLIIITRAAFAVTEGVHDVEIVDGHPLGIGVTVALSLVLVVVRIGVSLLSNLQSARIVSTVSADVRTELADAFFDASWGVQQNDESGRLQEVLTNFADRAGSVVSAITVVIASVFSLLAILGLAVAVNPAASVIVLGAVVGLGALLWPIRRVIERFSKRTVAARIALASSLNEISQVGMEVHVFNVQPMAKAQVGHLIADNRNSQARLAFIQGIVPTLYSGLAYIVLAGAVAVVAASDSSNLTSLGASMLLMLRSLFYGQLTQTNIASISSSQPFIHRLFTQIEIYRDGHVADHGEPIESVATLRLEHVGFEYELGKPVLFDIDLTIDSRQMVCIIGPSGGGKSTMVQLMLGLRQPTSGRVLADGRDVSRIARDQWARRVTFVPQTPHLISGTVADNIRFFRPDVSAADIERAARLAHLHDDVLGWSGGYEHQVGPRGSGLSGGQQQRICIARALVEAPDVIVLDEPTSALDGISESLIRDTLGQLRSTMTVIVIAHRLSTLSLCDRLIILEDGRVKDFDTPANLEMASEFYRSVLTLSGPRPM